jgi:hypothetical protein
MISGNVGRAVRPFLAPRRTSRTRLVGTVVLPQFATTIGIAARKFLPCRHRPCGRLCRDALSRMALSRPQLIDHGMFSQPRYEAVFGDIPLNATGKYSYTFSRFPAAEAMIMLLTPGRPPLEAIQNLDTELRLRMVGQDGTVHCAGAGSLRDRLPERLKISSSDRVDGVS